MNLLYQAVLVFYLLLLYSFVSIRCINYVGPFSSKRSELLDQELSCEPYDIEVCKVMVDVSNLQTEFSYPWTELFTVAQVVGPNSSSGG